MGPAVADSGGGSMRLPGLLGGTKTEELRGGGPPFAYGISPWDTCELRPGGGRDIFFVEKDAAVSETFGGRKGGQLLCSRTQALQH